VQPSADKPTVTITSMPIDLRAYEATE
jgi:hypothetical protein